MSPTSPITVAALIGPTPNKLGQRCLRRCHRGGDASTGVTTLGVEADQVGDELHGAQTENAGEIIFGLALAFIAGSTSSTVALTCCAGSLACAGLVVSRARE